MKKTIFFFVSLFTSLASFATQAEAPALSSAEQNRMLLQVDTLIAHWSGNGTELEQASDILAKVLKANPKNLEAQYQKARYFLANRDLNEAQTELDKALEQNPTWHKGQILLGAVYTRQGRPVEAIKIFERAEADGADSNWLYVDWGEALARVNNWREAEKKLEKVRVQKKLTSNELIQLNSILISVYDGQRRLLDADKAHKTLISLKPKSAWAHGNYANFLLLRRGLPDEAMKEAEKALKIMDYGAGRETLGFIQYAKWAQLKDKDPAAAKKYLQQAQENAPDLTDVFLHVGKSVDAGPAVENLVLAMMEKGISINKTDSRGETAFTLAAGSGNIVAMQWLAAHGANIDITTNKMGALGYAVEQNDEATLDALLALKAEVNTPGLIYGLSPFMWAAARGYESIVKKLVKAGVSRVGFIIVDGQQKTAEDFARTNGHSSLADYLHAIRSNKTVLE